MELRKDPLGRSEGKGHVQFVYAKDAKEAVNGMNGQAVEDKLISARLASEVQVQPPPSSRSLPQPNRAPAMVRVGGLGA